MGSSSGRITTFYSYKGGTGRSMALANFAWILAASGKQVLVIDWDLEAPGLHRYFRPFLVDPDLFETDGLIDAFWAFTASTLAKTLTGGKSIGRQDSDDVIEALDAAARRLDYEFSTGGYIDFIGAGRQSETYSERVNSFDWKRFYELGGAQVLSAAKAHMREHYDWVLIDSRTGVSTPPAFALFRCRKRLSPASRSTVKALMGLPPSCIRSAPSAARVWMGKRSLSFQSRLG